MSLSGSLGEQETTPQAADKTVPQLFQVLPNFHKCFYLTIRLWARDFYEVIVDEVEGQDHWDWNII